MKKIYIMLGLIVLISVSVFSQGFILSPHRDVFVDVDIGTPVASPKYGGVIKIKNKSPYDMEYVIKIRKPSDYKRKPMFGYVDIPNPDFVKVPEKFDVKANSERIIPFKFNIPDDIKYYNRKWEAEIIVTGIKGNIGIELMGQLFIETKGKEIKESVEKNNLDKWWLCPSIIEFDKYKDEKSVYIHNTSSQTLTFLIVSESPPMAVVELFIPLSNGYERLEDEEWVEPIISGEEKIRRIKRGREIQPQKKIVLKPGEVREMKVKIDVPDKKEFKGKKFESYIFVRSPFYDDTRFVRLRVEKR